MLQSLDIDHFVKELKHRRLKTVRITKGMQQMELRFHEDDAVMLEIILKRNHIAFTSAPDE